MDRVLEPEVMDDAEEAAAYEAMDHGEVNAAFVDRLLELGAGGPMIEMLDLGCGPGHIPMLVVERLPEARVLGIDLAVHMLEAAERRRVASPHAARVELRRGDAKALDLPDASFDAVFSNTLLHHLPDPAPFLAEARRVLRPGGVLLIRDLYRPSSLAELDALVARHAATASPAGRELFRASLQAALTPAELRAAADEAGLKDAELVLDTDRHMSLQSRFRARS